MKRTVEDVHPEEYEDVNQPEEKKEKQKEKTGTASEFLTDIEYSTLSLHENLQRALDDAGYSKMTTIQHRSIPLLLNGKDILAKARTGSGKTLAFLIPIIENLNKLHFQNRNGTGAIILSPTRELAIQIFDVLEILLKYSERSRALVIGGSNKKTEEETFPNSFDKSSNTLIPKSDREYM